MFSSACKKSSSPTGGGTTPVIPPAKYCQLVCWKATESAYPTYFEFNAAGKMIKSRWYPNGIQLRPLTRIFSYNNQNQLTSIMDSVGTGEPLNMNTSFSDYNGAGCPQKANHRFGNKPYADLEFVYDSKNNISKKIFLFYDNSGNPVLPKDSMNFYYNADGNIIKETAITKLNGIRREYILLEAEGYDTKLNFYKSLGNEYNLLYRYNRGGDSYLSLGDYTYSISANNPGKVYLHNQSTDDSDKGDYLSYTYEYDAVTGLPAKISFMNTSGGITRGPGFATAIYNCK
jgi:hypothetical protein